MMDRIKKNFPLISCILILNLVLAACRLPSFRLEPTPTPFLGEPPELYDLFVSLTGDDENDCRSEENACRTVAAAFRKSNHSSTIFIGPGEFRHSLGTSLTPVHDLNLIGAGSDATVLLTDRNLTLLRISQPLRLGISDMTIGRTLDINDIAGGTLEIRNSRAEVTLENCIVRDGYIGVNNVVPVEGGGAQLTIRNCIFDTNDYGLTNAGNLIVEDSIFRNNASTRGGTPFSNGGQARFENTRFENNGAASGGAASAAISNSGMLEINGGEIVNNIGDGITMRGGSLTLTGVLIGDNGRTGLWHTGGTTEVWSGIIRNSGSYGVNLGGRSEIEDLGSVQINNSAILGNRTGGLRLDGGTMRVRNSTISGNLSTSSGGGGIWQYGGSLNLFDSTIAFNQGHGLQTSTGSRGSTVAGVWRTIIALNIGEQCNISAGSTVLFSSPNEFACSGDWTQASLGLGGLVEEAGTFVHPIQPGSPLIDAGGSVASCPANDQRLFVRPAGSTCDIGAYEFGASLMALEAESAEPQTPEAITTLTEPATPTPETLIPIFVFDQNANCRRGPGTGYLVTTSFEQGQELELGGRNADQSWFLVRIPDTRASCWVSAVTGRLLGDLDLVLLANYPPIPNSPSQLAINDRMCSPNGYMLKLTWVGDPDNATGQRIYRNGALLATLGANITSYEDQPPFGGPYTYALEAFNEDGVSGQAQVTDTACEE
jgi:hypothetical protein